MGIGTDRQICLPPLNYTLSQVLTSLTTTETEELSACRDTPGPPRSSTSPPCSDSVPEDVSDHGTSAFPWLASEPARLSLRNHRGSQSQRSCAHHDVVV